MNPLGAIGLLCVGLGGAAGSVVRYMLTVALQSRTGSGFPVATLLINIAGSLLLGGLMGYFSEDARASAEIRLLLTSGFCGGFTTFSTFSWETFSLFRDGEQARAAAYVGLSVAAAVIGLALGFALTRGAITARRG